jgi:hypothetical protein
MSPASILNAFARNVKYLFFAASFSPLISRTEGLVIWPQKEMIAAISASWQ